MSTAGSSSFSTMPMAKESPALELDHLGLDLCMMRLLVTNGTFDIHI